MSTVKTHTGRVKVYYKERKYGFITCLDFENDIFVYIDNVIEPIPPILSMGQMVEFSIAVNDKGWIAQNVKPYIPERDGLI